ncbi:hypothetical protein ACS0TY_022187 [Phlomoides rotata]
MTKVHPKSLMITSCSEFTSSKRETLTLWMKSLVINGNGCSVFDSGGHLLFRVDNYQKRCTTQILLMNFDGQLLFSITSKKKMLVFRRCEGRKWMESKGEWFRVRREFKFFGTRMSVVLGCCNKTTTNYKILGGKQKSTLKIVDCQGGVLAEVVQKQTVGGICLGDDVFSLIVEPQIDQSLVMALVIAYAMINNKL